MSMDTTETIAALRPLQSHHSTASGVQVGFFMQEAIKVMGSLADASEALSLLMAEGLIESAPVVMDGEVHTIFRIADASPPTSRSIH